MLRVILVLQGFGLGLSALYLLTVRPRHPFSRASLNVNAPLWALMLFQVRSIALLLWSGNGIYASPVDWDQLFSLAMLVLIDGLILFRLWSYVTYRRNLIRGLEAEPSNRPAGPVQPR